MSRWARVLLLALALIGCGNSANPAAHGEKESTPFVPPPPPPTQINVTIGPGDSWTGDPIDSQHDGFRLELSNLIAADVASGDIPAVLIPNGLQINWIGPRFESTATPPTQNHEGFGGTTTHDHIFGRASPTPACPAVSAYWGAGNPGGDPPLHLYIVTIGHNNDYGSGTPSANYEDSTHGIIPLIDALHAANPSAIFAFGDPMGSAISAAQASKRAFVTSTVLPHMTAAGLSWERWTATLEPGDATLIDQGNAHPTPAGYTFIANAMHTAVKDQIIRLLGGIPMLAANDNGTDFGFCDVVDIRVEIERRRRKRQRHSERRAA